MASYAKHIPFLFLTFLCLSLHIQARESKFFSKVTKNNVIGSKTPILETPTSAPAPAPESSDTLSENGYGLYGRDDSSEFPTTTPTTITATFTTANEENEALNEELEKNRKYETSYATNNNYYNNNNQYPNGNYNNNGYNNNGYNSNNNNNYYNDGYGEEKQGMSDTRFLEKGRYHYDPKNRGSNGNYNGYEPAGRGSTTRDEVYNGNNNVNANEFNTMEEYYQSQHEYQGNQEGYEP